MRVVLVAETYSPDMGYLVTMLPKYLARRGLDVHLVANDLPPYFNLNEFGGKLPRFLRDQALKPGTFRNADGYTVHILRHRLVLGYPALPGLAKLLAQLRPEVVYCITTIGWQPLQAAFLRPFLRYRLFTGSHTSTTVLSTAKHGARSLPRLRNLLLRWLPGRLVSLGSEMCYCPTRDCMEVASRFFGVQRRKLRLVHLGVDLDFFHPVQSAADRAEREQLRREFGVGERDILCIYTGKMVASKNPLLLAQAVATLRAEGRPWRALFIGEGTESAAVAAQPGSLVRGFMPFRKLGRYYRAADVAVWPTNESTSMLDAAACGLPLVVSDRIYQDHVTGNGIAYRMNDLHSLLEALRRLEAPEVREQLGRNGVLKMRSAFSWAGAAEVREQDFRNAIPAAARAGRAT